METLRVEKEGHFCWLKLNRPEAMNALNTQMAKDLIAVRYTPGSAGVTIKV